MAHLRPPNIVGPPGRDRTDDGSHFIDMQLVAGYDLA